VTLEQVCNDNYRFVLWCTSNEDATQTTFVKVCKAWKPAYEQWSEQQIRAWLRRIANNTLIDTERYNGHRNHEELGEGYIAPGDVESDVEACMRYRTALSNLTPEQRRVLLLSAQGYDYREIYVDRVRSAAMKLSRTRKALKVELAKIA